ncbi:hypothetical protein AYI69_g431 [Smittium culicis]|uniref:Uncharacterized protein n=1 Tax=Smittium culicis TaxID=133412 RepID=A0A1R1YT15_9FUNG|nr:hypothetical protein AYI69_g431 [Smittium culicis]
MNQESLDTLIEKKTAKRRQRVQAFRKRQHNTIPKDTYSSNTASAQINNALTAAEASSNKTSDRQINFRGRGSHYRPKKTPSRGPEATDPSSTSELSTLSKEQTLVSVPCLAIWAITENFGIHQDSNPGSTIVESEGSPNIFLSG